MRHGPINLQLALGIVICIGLGCARQPAPTPAPPPAPVFLTPQDREVLEAAFLAFLEDPEVRTGARKGRQLVLHPTTLGPRVAGGPQQMPHSLRRQLPGTAFADLGRRNQEPVSLNEMGSERLDIVIDDLSDLDRLRWYTQFQEKFPDARAHVQPWLPGYTRDDSAAVVRIMFGPSAHGATATYLLCKTAEGWSVVFGHVVYYA